MYYLGIDYHKRFSQVAQYLQMDEHTVYRLARQRVLPSFKIAGQWRFKKDLIDRWIEEGSLKNIKIDLERNNHGK